jgi:MFS transporter, putative metabolite transport protein
VWVLATAGKLFEGLIVAACGIALPQQAAAFAITPASQGLVAAASLVGILLGAVGLGAMADRYGRRALFIAEMLLLAFGLLAAALSPSTPWLLAALLLIGLALGADYPTAHLVISESVPAPLRGRMVLAAFGTQALGVVLGSAMAAWLPLPSWRWLYLVPVLPVLLVAVARLAVPESSQWLLSRGQQRRAEQQLMHLLQRPDLRLSVPPLACGAAAPQWRPLLQPPLRRGLLLACLPWFLQDLSTYGVVLFTPVLLLTATDAALPQLPQQVTQQTALIDLALVPGIIGAILLVDRWGRIPLQILGFVGCAAGLLVAASGPLLPGLLLFQFMTNLGPNPQTYLLAGELFPTPVRGIGAGLAAASGKLGAVLTALVLPPLLARWGSSVLPVLAATSLLGAAVTWAWRPETTAAPA